MSKQAKANYLEGNVGKTLLFNSIPMVFGIGAAMSFSFVDAYWVGKLGTKHLAAMTFTFPIDFIVMGIAFGLGIGASAEISKAIGKGDHERVRKLTRDILIVALLIVTVFIACSYTFFDSIFRMLGASEDILPLIKDFMRYWIPGQFALVVPLIINSATRAMGDTKTPSYIMIGAGLLNLIINPLFIFGWYGFPQMGIAGSSLSTLISRIFTLILSFYLINNRDKMLTLAKPVWEDFKANTSDMMKVGLPSAITNLIMPTGIALVIKFVSLYGAAAVAAFGIASRIDMTALVVFMALASVVGPFIGQNLGAGQFERIRLSLRLSYLFAFVWGAAMILLFYFYAAPLSIMIKDDKAVVAIMVVYLTISSIGMAFRGIAMINTTSLNVLQRPNTSAMLTLSQIFVFFIPLAYLSTKTIGLNGIFWANVVAGICVAAISYFIVGKAISNLELERSKPKEVEA